LRGELQALDHSKIGEELIREILHGHARANGNRCGLNEFARFRRYRLRADQPASLTCVTTQMFHRPRARESAQGRDERLQTVPVSPVA
jgi:hypothetical protein